MVASLKIAATTVAILSATTMLTTVSAREIEQAAIAGSSARQACIEHVDDAAPSPAKQVGACSTFLAYNDATSGELATAHLARAHAQAVLGNWKAAAADYLEAIDGFNALIEKTQPNPLYTYRRATAYHALGDSDRALADYNSSIERSPRKAIAFLNRGILLARYKQQYLSATADFDEALGLEPNNLAALMLRGEAKSILGEYPAALTDLDRAARIAPEAPQIQVLLGLTHSRQGETVKAIADYDRALMLDGNNIDALTNRAALRAVADENAQAIADLDRVLKLQPANALALYNRGYSHFALKQYDDAIADYSAALSANPQMAMAYTNRCLVRVITGRDADGARADCKRAAGLLPQSPDVRETQAFLHLKLGEPKAALAEYEAALAIDSTRPIALYGRSLARQQLGDTAGAGRDRDTALLRYPAVAQEFTAYGVK